MYVISMSIVVLSGSSDFQLRIWSVLDGSNPVTLKAHTKGITDSAVIDRGRNVLCKLSLFIYATLDTHMSFILIMSCIYYSLAASSRDGTIRLWECGD